MKYRQQLGELSSSEVKEARKALRDGTHYVTTAQHPVPKGSPAHLSSWNFPLLAGAIGAGVGMGAYGKFVRGTSIIWLVGSALPFLGWMVYNHNRQPSQLLCNHYEYILQKRVATV